ncbi:MAG: alanine/glycine:cation symporter family protein [Anaerovoracaceae bacterium]
MLDKFQEMLSTLDSYMYYPILIIILALGGLYFSFRTRFVQIRYFIESIRVLREKPSKDSNVSSFQALMVSTASRVGTGNIIGVSTAVCLGGPGAVFWMWILAIIGGASAFIESTLAQIYKKRNPDGTSYGGPAYYIEQAMNNHFLAGLFAVFLISTYAFGFNMVCSYNLQSTFAEYSFYNENITPWIIGGLMAVLVCICILGGGKSIERVSSIIVPFMGIFYLAIALIVIFVNYKNIPGMFGIIFADAFDFRSISSGIAGSCLIYGIKRGLYSNEAGVGSAPNAAAAADVSHPVKQGLVQTLSVYIDTLILCTATAFMCIASGAERTEAVAGAPYVQNAVSSVFGSIGPIFITVAMILFAFTTLIGNLYYTNNALAFLNKKKMPSKTFMTVYRIICVIVIFIGAGLSMEAAWALADITMGLMTLINIPCCIILGGVAFKALRDYESQKKENINPVFKAKKIGIDSEKLDFWK